MKRNIKLTPIRLIHYVAGGSLGLLIILTLVMLLPSTHNTASATCATGDGGENCASMQATTELALNLKTAISVALDNQVQMDITPRSNGATSYATTKLSVSTNSNDGYGIFLMSESAEGNLLSNSADNSAVISNTNQSDVSLENMEKNTYGYALESTPASDATKYSHVPTTNTAIKSTKSVTATDLPYAYGDTYYLSFGTKIGTDIPAGSYSGAVTVSTVANPRTIANLSDLTYMQEMSSDICTNTREGYTKQLIDIRDGKSYWVAKLKDGNCWMTQNLALDITEAGLSATDTDITEDWNQDSEYPPVNGNRILLSGKSFISKPSTITDYWNLGLSMMATPLVTEVRESKSCHFMNGDGQTLGTMCEQFGFVDLDETWKPTFTAQEGTWTFDDGTEYTGLVTVDKNAKTYDSHYLLGNYYTYNAATAGSGGDLENGVAENSICPKNWQLPKTAESLDSTEKSYFALLSAYDLVSISNISASYTGAQKMIEAPLYFAAYSQTYPWGGYASVGSSGDYTTSTASLDKNSKYILHLNFSVTADSISLDRADGPFQAGFQMRCVAR